MDFQRSPFLKDIYLDKSPELVIKKSVQIGISEMLICEAFGMADNGLRVFYVLPTIDLRNQFVRDRIDRPLLTIPYYRHRVKPTGKVDYLLEVDNVGLKSFGESGVLFFVGSNSPVSFISFPADVAIIDEFDKCDPHNLSAVPDRLSASPYKYIRKVSTPTVEGFGIDEEYNQSDRKHWLIKCEHCGEWQELDFFKNVIQQTGDNSFELVDQEWSEETERDVFIFCQSCGKVFERLSPGEWVAEDNTRKISGFTLSHLISANTTIRELWQEWERALKNETKKQRFYNSLLGLAYTARGVKLTKAILDECIKAGQGYNTLTRSANTTMGVDVGGPLHVIICDHPSENNRRVIYAGVVQEFEELHTLIAKYGVRSCVIDVKPETRKAKDFQAEANCEVWLCEYPTSPQQDDLRIDLTKKYIYADRTQTLDALVNDYLSQLILLPANASSLCDGDFYKQLCAPTRVMDEDTKRYYYTEGSHADHFCHASNYERIANKFFTKEVETEYVEVKNSFPHRREKRKR